MSIRFDPLGNVSGALRVKARIMDSLVSPASLLNTNAWQLECFVNSDWNDVVAGEKFLGIRLIKVGDDNLLEFSFNFLSGIYRLNTTLSEVDSDYNKIYFKHEPDYNEPYYLQVEGLNLNGSNIIPSYYLSQSSPASSLSRKLDQECGIATSGGMEINLVDLDGDLSNVFTPRSADIACTFVLSEIGIGDDAIMLVSNSNLPDSGFIYIGSEVIYYNGLSGDHLILNCNRGTLDTSPQNHQENQPVYTTNPYYKNRSIWIKRPVAYGYSENDDILFNGIIDSLSPGEDNLACYKIQISDPLLKLQANIGRKMGSGMVLNQLMIEGEGTSFGRRGNDTLYFRHSRQPTLGWDTFAIRLAPGAYLTGSDSLGHEKNIATALQKAIEKQEPGLAGEFTIGNDGRLEMKFNIGYLFQLQPSGQVQGNHDSILESIGFEEKPSEIYTNDNGIFTLPGTALELISIAAQSKIQSGVGRNNRKIYLAGNPLGENDINSFKNGSLAQIDDELVYYESVQNSGNNVVADSALQLGINSEDNNLIIEETHDFPANGGFVKIGDEIIFYSSIKGGNTLADCFRGAWNTETSIHSSYSSVKLIVLPYLQGCVRGLFNSIPAAHDGSSLICEAWCSDILSQPIEGKVIRTHKPPDEFLLDLLCKERASSLHGLEISPNQINLDSFKNQISELPINYDQTFMRLVFAEETYKDVIADICTSTNTTLYMDNSGLIALGAMSPKLLHEKNDVELDHNILINAPKISWREDLIINRVEASIDYDPIFDTYLSKIIVDDDSKGNSPALDNEDHIYTFSSRCLHTKGHYGQGGGDNWCYDLAWNIIRQYNKFITSATVDILPSIGNNLSLLSSIELSSNALPIGDGERGAKNVHYHVIDIDKNLSKNFVRLGLLERGSSRYAGFSPSATILSYVEASNSIIISRDMLWPDKLTPADVFSDFDNVKIKYLHQFSGDNFVVSIQLTIAENGIDISEWENGSASITFANVPIRMPMLGDVLISDEYSENQIPDSLLPLFVSLANDQALLDLDQEAFIYTF